MGNKNEVKRLLTGYLASVGQEETEVISINNDPKTITKAEALARQLWLMALGGEEEFIDDDGQTLTRIYKPDRKAAELIYSYLEGRPTAIKPGKEVNREKPHGFTSDTKQRLNEALEVTNNESDEKV